MVPQVQTHLPLVEVDQVVQMEDQVEHGLADHMVAVAVEKLIIVSQEVAEGRLVIKTITP